MRSANWRSVREGRRWVLLSGGVSWEEGSMWNWRFGFWRLRLRTGRRRVLVRKSLLDFVRV